MNKRLILSFFGEKKLCFHTAADHHPETSQLEHHYDTKEELQSVLQKVNNALDKGENEVKIRGLQQKIKIETLRKEVRFFEIAEKFKSSLSGAHLLTLSFLKGPSILQKFFLAKKSAGDQDTLTAKFAENKNAQDFLGLGDMLPVSQEYVKMTYNSLKGRKRFADRTEIIGVRGIKNTRKGERPAYIDIETGEYLPIWEDDSVDLISPDDVKDKEIKTSGLEDDEVIFVGESIKRGDGKTVPDKVQKEVLTAKAANKWQDEVSDAEFEKRFTDDESELGVDRNKNLHRSQIEKHEFMGSYAHLAAMVNGGRAKQYAERIPLMDTDLLQLMKSISDKFGNKVKFSCTLRTQEDNDRITKQYGEKNVSQNSYHMYGLAFDISRHSEVELAEVKRFIDRNYPTINGQKVFTLIHGEKGNRHLHVDIRKDRAPRKKWTEDSVENGLKDFNDEKENDIRNDPHRYHEHAHVHSEAREDAEILSKYGKIALNVAKAYGEINPVNKKGFKAVISREIDKGKNGLVWLTFLALKEFNLDVDEFFAPVTAMLIKESSYNLGTANGDDGDSYGGLQVQQPTYQDIYREFPDSFPSRSIENLSVKNRFRAGVANLARHYKKQKDVYYAVQKHNGGGILAENYKNEVIRVVERSREYS